MQLGTGRGSAVCDNVQTAVDRKHTLIVANDVTHDTGDRDCLSPMALQAQAILGSPGEAVAAVGDYHGEAVQTCLEAGMTPSMACPITTAHEKLGLFSKDDCGYDQATGNQHVCIANQKNAQICRT